MQNDNQNQSNPNFQPLQQEPAPQEQPVYPVSVGPETNNQAFTAPSPLQSIGVKTPSSRQPVSASFIAYFLIGLATLGYVASMLTGFYYASWIFSGDSPGYEIALIVGAPLLALVGLVMIVRQARQKIFVSHVLAMITAVYIIFSSLSSLSVLVYYQISSDNYETQTSESFDDSFDFSSEQ